MSQLPDTILYLNNFILSDAPITYRAPVAHNYNTYNWFMCHGVTLIWLQWSHTSIIDSHKNNNSIIILSEWAIYTVFFPHRIPLASFFTPSFTPTESLRPLLSYSNTSASTPIGSVNLFLYFQIHCLRHLPIPSAPFFIFKYIVFIYIHMYI